MPAEDPHPSLAFLDAIDILKGLFPDSNLDYHPTTGEVFISLPLTDGQEFRAALTWQQAKYLAVGAISGDDLKAGRLPKDWPA